jgi:hypothetical protein
MTKEQTCELDGSKVKLNSPVSCSLFTPNVSTTRFGAVARHFYDIDGKAVLWILINLDLCSIP